MIIKVKNNLDINAPYTFFSEALGLGASTIPVKNINNFNASWAIQVGKTGEERAETLMLGTSPSSATALLITGTTRYPHSTDTPIYATKFDQVVFKRSTAGTAGTATAMSSGTVTITPDSIFTQFDDTSGATTYAYRVAYRNSVTTDVSSDSDWLTPSGYSFYSLFSVRERLKGKLRSASYIKDDSTIDDWTNEWVERLNNVLVDVNQDYSLGTVDVSFGTAGLGTVTSTDFKEIRRIWVTYNGTDYYNATKMHVTDFENQDVFSSSQPSYYMYGDSVFGVKPESGGGTARIVYYKLNTVLVNDTDELPVPMRGYTKTFVDYVLSQAYYLDKRVDLGKIFNNNAEVGLDMFRNEVTPRSKTGPQFIKLTDSVSDDIDGLMWGP